jgi:hypothetical protein
VRSRRRELDLSHDSPHRLLLRGTLKRAAGSLPMSTVGAEQPRRL